MSKKTNKNTDVNNQIVLKAEIELKPRFSEVDMMRVVWHGNYLDYMEEGREAFGAKYKMGYMDFKDQGFAIPLVHCSIDYKKSLKYGDRVRVETTYENSKAAKIIFSYKLFNTSDNSLVATGKSIQVFVDFDGNLELLIPEFYQKWKDTYLV